MNDVRRGSAPRVCRTGGWFCVLTVAVGLGWWTPSTSAQVGGANVGGIVKDTTGARLPGVTVTISNTATGREQVIVTGPEGNYRAVALQPGPYAITAELQGFATERREVTLNVGTDATLDITLSIAGVAETVTVSAENVMVEVTKSQLSSVVQPEQVSSLPVLTRSFVELAQLLPGTGINNTQGQAFISTRFGGAALQKNAFTTLIDGGSVDDAIGGGTRVNISQDAVQEFTVLRNQFDAEYGSALNAAVVAVTKSGTNQFHGTAYYFGRDASLNATNAFAKSKPPFDQQRLGATFGGPIVKDQTHFFGSYEYNNVDTVNIIALPPSNPFAEQENGIYPRPSDNHLAIAKVDHRFNERQSLMARYLYDNRSETGAAGSSNTNVTDQVNRNHSLVVEDNWILSQEKLNTFRVHYIHQNLAFLPHSNDLTISRPSVTTGSATFAPQFWPRNDVTLYDTFYINTPQHSFKMGGDIRFQHLNYDSFVNDQGLFSFQTDAPFDSNNPQTWPFAFTIQQPAHWSYNSNHVGLFLQDDWSISDRVHLNLGLRYDLETNLRNNDFHQSLLTDPAYAGIENFITGNRGNDWNNFQPRFGATWDVRGNGTLVMRGGSGLYVTRNWPWVQLTGMDQTGAVSVRIEDQSQLRLYPDVNAVLGGKSLEDFLASGGARPLLLVSDNFELPYSWNTSVGFGWQINPNTSFDVDYIHDYAAGQLGGTDRNLPPTGRISPSNPRPVANFSQVIMMENYTKTWYDALETQFRARIGGSSNVLVSYTLSRSYQDGVDHYNTLRGTQRTPNERGYNPNDTLHNLTMSGAFRLPWQIEVAGIGKFISGFPLPVQAGYDIDGDLSAQNDRPPGLPTTVGRENVDESLRIINDLRASRGLPPIDRKLLNLDTYVSIDARVTKSLSLGASGSHRVQLFLEAYNITNHVNYLQPNKNIISTSFLIRSSARDARQIQWGVRYAF